MKKKKMNIYVKYGLIIGTAMLIGAVIGFSVEYFGLARFGSMGGEGLLKLIERNILFLMGFVFAASLLLGEWNLGKQKSLAQKILTAEDEEADELEDALEVAGSWGTIRSHVSMVLVIILMTCAFSDEYMQHYATGRILLLAVLFLVLYSYEGFWQVRMVRMVQKAFPERMGDPTSRRFQKDWLESCDEAEQEVIYKSAYRAYITNMKVYGLLMAVAMISHMMWATGLMAVVMVGIIWCTTTVSYCRACVTNRRRVRKK